MGRKSIQKERSRHRGKRRRILQEITHMVFTKGIVNSTVDDWADVAGISKATFYNHFGSQEECVTAILEQKITAILGFQELFKQEDVPMAERYRAGFELLAEEVSPVSIQFLRDLRTLFPALFQRVEQLMEFAAKELETFYKQGIEEGVFAKVSPTLLARTDLAFFRLLTDPSEVERMNMSVEEACKHYFELRCNGLLLHPAP